MKGPVRRLLRRLAIGAGTGVLRASRRLVRLEIVGDEDRLDEERRQRGVIYAFWHGRLWLPASAFGPGGAAVLVSLSEDGEVIARVASRLGFHPVRGSSSRGGREGLQGLAEALQSGRSVALTPDGPRGPRQIAQMGAVVLAARTGRPVIPLGAAARPAHRLNSWDRFQLPWPGARGVIVFGPPLLVPEDPDLEPWRQRLEEILNGLQESADRKVSG